MSPSTSGDPYPIPTSPPTYTSLPVKVRGRRVSLYGLLNVVFILAALGLTVWFAGLLLREGLSFDPVRLLCLVLFWATLAYLALPRLHQIFTVLYVPDYFIGRTRTADGLLGDPVNLALDGSADDIHAAMQAAGWVLADEITLRSALGIIRSSVARTSYPAAPVSSLYLFGRRQAFAYQQEVDGNASRRHHVRFWPVPQGWKLPGGDSVQWLAAGTYDHSVGLSLFTGQVTHKIDADIDVERDYIIDTVRYADHADSVRVIKDFSTAYHSRNGGGDVVSTDGDLPILNVTGAAQRKPGFALPPASPTSVSDRKLPPLPLLISCLILGLGLLLVALVGGIVLAVSPDTSSLGPDAKEFLGELPLYLTGAVLGLVFIALTLARHRWGRAGLMVLALIMAVSEMGNATAAGSLSLTSIISIGVSLLVVLGLTSESTEEWITRGKQDLEVRLG